jgi:ParB family chromosome partitioning protein
MSCSRSSAPRRRTSSPSRNFPARRGPGRRLSGPFAFQRKSNDGCPKAREEARRKRRGPAAPRGPGALEAALDLADELVAQVAAAVRDAGGTPLAALKDPYAGAPLLLASLPLKCVEPTTFQRDLSRTHADRLGRAIEATGSFLDPIIAVGAGDAFLTPNGRHRLAAAKQLGLRAITALVVADPRITYRILALNTEKAHNLRDRSLEAFRMSQALAVEEPRSREADHAAAFEEPLLLTLGAAYTVKGRFAGSSYQPMLRRVDAWVDRPLPAALRQREQYATRLIDIDERITAHVHALQERGFKSPYLRQLVVARCNPVRFLQAKRGGGPVMPIAEALTRMAAAARKFAPASVRHQDLALVAAVAEPES